MIGEYTQKNFIIYLSFVTWRIWEYGELFCEYSLYVITLQKWYEPSHFGTSLLILDALNQLCNRVRVDFFLTCCRVEVFACWQARNGPLAISISLHSWWCCSSKIRVLLRFPHPKFIVPLRHIIFTTYSLCFFFLCTSFLTIPPFLFRSPHFFFIMRFHSFYLCSFVCLFLSNVHAISKSCL